MKSLRERIGLKILRLIDRCIDSFEKRIFLFIFFLCLYWLWQNVWQLILFGKLFFVTDYESLFHIQSTLSMYQFQSTLSMYQSSVFIRILYYVISNPNLNVLKLISCIKLIDILAILGVILLIKKFRIVVIFNGIKYVWGLFWVVKALNSKSVYLVISCLKWLSLGLFISMLIVSIVLLYTLSKMITDYDDFVHEL